MKKIQIGIFLALCFSPYVFGQEVADTLTKKERKKQEKLAEKNKEPQKGDIYFTPVPVFGANPAMGFIFGVGATTSWYMGDPKTTKISNLLAGGSYTTKGQLIATLKGIAYTEDNELMLITDARYMNSSQPTYGLGTGPQSAKLVGTGFEYEDGNGFSEPMEDAQLMNYQFARVYQTVLKKVRENLYLGVGFHFDRFFNVEDNLLNLDTVPQAITSYYAYNEKYGFEQDASNLVGASLNVIYDTRDNQNNPYKGRFAYVSAKYNPTFFGSDQTSSSLWVEYRDYINFNPRTNHDILGFWTYGNFTTSGNLPYMGLPAISYDQFAKSGRGYTQGRFRGQSLVYGEIEYRRHLLGTKSNPNFMGMVLFSNVTTASSKGNDIDLFDYMEPAAGAGLRFMLNKKARSNLTIDYAFGKYGSNGLFIRLNETF